METAAAGSYHGGVGGKFKRRPARRAATPYDRPPPALRNPDGPERNGWLSKLVDPASRIIADSASKLFQSVFRRRLPALPAKSNQEAIQELPKPVYNQSTRQQEEGDENVKDHNSNKPVCNGINEFEQLLKHKTFTRDEFNRLTELLLSRTVDLSATEKLRSADDDKKRTEPSTYQNLPTHEGRERQDISAPENGLGTSGLMGHISTPGVGPSASQEVASPTEVAKEFMGSRALRVSPTTLGLRSQALMEDLTFPSIVPFRTPRSSNMSFTPRSSRLLLDSGYGTPRPRGRSAIYNMARSPYMRDRSAVALKGPDVTEDDYEGSSTVSPWARNLLSGGKQALKRRSSVLDTDFGSVGPIRRIRQKSNLMTPSKSTSSPPRTLMKPLSSDAEKLAELDRPSNLQSSENGDERMTYTSVPPQSSEMARKILQQLDKLVPSPKEKSSEQKLALAREKSPSRLTTDMLSGRALKSIEGIESPKFKLTQGTWSLDKHGNGMDLPGPRNDFPQRHDKVEKNGPSKISSLGAKLVSEIGVVDGVATSARDTTFSSKAATTAMFRSDSDQLPSKRAFHMSAPEDSLDMDEDNCAIKAAAITSSGNEKEKMQASQADLKAVASEAGNASFESTKNAVTSLPCQRSETNEKALDVHPTVAGKDNGHPAFEFGTKTINKESSVTFRLPASVIPKFGAASDPKAETSDSKSMATGFLPVTSPQTTGSDKSEEFQKASNLFRSTENASSSALPFSAVPPVFSIAASTSSSQSNGVRSSSTSAVSVVATPIEPVFGSNSASTMASTSSPSMAASSSIFKSVSGISASSPNLNSHIAVSSGTDVTDSVVKNKLESIFSAPPSAFTGAGTTAFAFGASATSSAMTASSSSNDRTQTFGTFGSTTGSIFASQGPLLTQSVGSQLGSSSSSAPSFGLNASSSFDTTGSIFGSANSAAKPFGSGSGIGMNPPVSFASGSSSSFDSVSTSASLFKSSSQPTSSTAVNTTTSSFGLGSLSTTSSKPSNLFDSTSQPGNSTTASLYGSSSQSAGSTSSIFGSSSQPASSTASIFGSSSQPASATASIFGSSSQPASSSPSIFGTNSQSTTSTSNIFGSSSQPANSTSSVFGLSSQPANSNTGIFGLNSQPASSVFTFGSSSPSPSTGFSFGSSIMPTGNGPLTFGSSSISPTFSFNSSTSGTSTTPFSSGRPMFQMSNAPVSFGAASPSNDQMNYEDSMAEDTVQASTVQAVSSFGQPASSHSPFMFGSTSVQSGGQQVFQFGGQAAPQNSSSPFAAAAGNLEVAPGGSFSLGTASTDKSNRKIVRVRRDKHRKK